MTEWELYREEVEERFRQLHKTSLNNYLHNVLLRFRRAGHTARDCAASIHYAIERETRKAEREVGDDES